MFVVRSGATGLLSPNYARAHLRLSNITTNSATIRIRFCLVCGIPRCAHHREQSKDGTQLRMVVTRWTRRPHDDSWRSYVIMNEGPVLTNESQGPLWFWWLWEWLCYFFGQGALQCCPINSIAITYKVKIWLFLFVTRKSFSYIRHLLVYDWFKNFASLPVFCFFKNCTN